MKFITKTSIQCINHLFLIHKNLQMFTHINIYSKKMNVILIIMKLKTLEIMFLLKLINIFNRYREQILLECCKRNIIKTLKFNILILLSLKWKICIIIIKFKTCILSS